MPNFTTPDGCRIFYEVHGPKDKNQALVFLNGTLQTALHWKGVLPFFSERLPVIIYDARAQGKSDLGDLPLSLPIHADDLSGLLDHIGIQKTHLAGVSHGARVAMTFAVSHPEQTLKLVLCGIGAARGIRSRLYIVSWRIILEHGGLMPMIAAAIPLVFGEDFLNRNQHILDGIQKTLVRKNNKDSLLKHLDAMNQYPPISDTAARVDRPCLVLAGADDALVPPDSAKRLASLCKAGYIVFPNTGHSLPAEAPDRFKQAVMEFLNAGK